MQRPSAAPVLARIAAVVMAMAAVVVLVYTALVNWGAAHHAVAAQPQPSYTTASSVPGSVPLPSQTTSYSPPALTSDTASQYLRNLAGRWNAASGDSYFTFRPNGSGTWTVYGNALWSGTARPVSATTFDLSAGGAWASYFQVTLEDGGKKLYFAGDQQTFTRA